ncbi:ankyrin repeat domain-containing protein 50 [Microdochium nivale]|nr:ankyrin repeat domain-containing protein 50 [Microdochium nivale]
MADPALHNPEAGATLCRTRTRTSISNLPPELIPLIAAHLSTESALALAATNGFHHGILTDLIYTRHIRTALLCDTPLWWACAQGKTAEHHALATASRALRLGADPGAKVYPGSRWWDYKHDTPLLLAVKNDSAAMVQLLMEYGADPCAAVMRHTAVTLAAEKGNSDVLACLLGPAPDVTTPCGSSMKPWARVPNSRRSGGHAPLHDAAISGRDACIHLLIKYGARVDIRAEDGGTPLHHAICGAKPTTVAILLDQYGADALAVDWVDQNALDLALHQANCAAAGGGGWELKARLDILRRLLAKHSAPPRIDESSGCSTRPRLLISEDRAQKLLVPPRGPSPSPEIVETLIAAGINVNARSDIDKANALSLFASTQPPPRDNGPGVDVAELLLDAGADIEYDDFEYGQTPLLRAAANGRPDYLALLLSRGADVGVRDRVGRSVLQLAAGADYSAGQMVQLLFDHQAQRDGSLSAVMAAQLNAKDKNGQTPLAEVVHRGFDDMVEMAKLLLQAGAQVSVALECDPTLLEACRQNGNTDMLDLLEGRTQVDDDDGESDQSIVEGAEVQKNEGEEAPVEEEDDAGGVGSWDIERDGDPSTWLL